jgi:two-component system, NarL family, invasion response regulator UvrY
LKSFEKRSAHGISYDIVISILIVDDQALVRRGLRQTLVEEFRDVFLGEARSGEEGVRAAAKRDWDLITLETAPSDAEVIQRLLQSCPKAKIMVLSAHASPMLAARAMHLGSVACLSKSAPLPELRRAIHKVLEGGTYIGRGMSKKANASAGAPTEEEAPPKALSARELQILAAICSGKSETAIAAELGLNIRTVSTYKRRTLNKLRLKSTASLVRYTIEHGLA